MAKETINITLDRHYWDELDRLAHEQSVIREERVTTIKMLSTAIHVFLNMENDEIDRVLKRSTRMAEEVFTPLPWESYQGL